jgi:hypothetical protein
VRCYVPSPQHHGDVFRVESPKHVECLRKRLLSAE